MTVTGATLRVGCRGKEAPTVGAAKDAARTPATVAPGEPEPRVSLSEEGWALVAAITERILPSDDGAGARETNIVRFIDRQLKTAQLRPLLEVVEQFLAAVAAWEKKHGARFTALDAAAQDRALLAMAAGKLDLEFDAQAEVFELLHGLTLEGFLSDPAYGGNREGAGWAYVGFRPAAMHHAGGLHVHEGQE
jgi:gluconate 2-dehydrogenase gamma chain